MNEDGECGGIWGTMALCKLAAGYYKMARRELCKPDASTVSICSLYTIEKDSRETGNLVIFDLD